MKLSLEYRLIVLSRAVVALALLLPIVSFFFILQTGGYLGAVVAFALIYLQIPALLLWAGVWLWSSQRRQRKSLIFPKDSKILFIVRQISCCLMVIPFLLYVAVYFLDPDVREGGYLYFFFAPVKGYWFYILQTVMFIVWVMLALLGLWKRQVFRD